MKVIFYRNDSGQSNLLRSFLLLMESNQASWDDVGDLVLHEVASYIIGRVKTVDQTALQTALAIMDMAVNQRCGHNYTFWK